MARYWHYHLLMSLNIIFVSIRLLYMLCAFSRKTAILLSVTVKVSLHDDTTILCVPA